MAEVNTELMRSRACERSFRVMMWGFLFLLPVPLKWQPDIGTWILLLAGLFAISALHEVVRHLQMIAAVGLALWVPRAILPHVAVAHQQAVMLLLYAATWVVAFVFVWRLCGLVAQMALKASADSVAQGARWRRWVPLIPLLLVALTPIARKAQLPDAVIIAVFVLAALVTVCALMGLMSTTARLCAQFRVEQQAVEPAAEADQAPEA
ncbi:MAG: hypothetical protein AMK73_02900 [Planctomycetes bacterium SM23_32]|nr:MAG: hypothetical protein AMK73_02900 [Planctomycetes bacterium SM23_32]